MQNSTHRQDTAVSSLCSPNFLKIALDSTVREAIRDVRASGPKGSIFYLYVVDRDDRLSGIVSIRNLLLAHDETPVSSVYSPQVVSLPKGARLSEAYEVFAQARFLSLPVVDERRRIIGVVHAHELAGEYEKGVEELFEERSRGELYDLLGIKAEDANSRSARIAFGRLPWLAINLLGGGISAVFIERLGGRLPRAVEFLAFVPTLLVISESVGMQTASMVITSLHRAGGRRPILPWKEIRVAALLGLCCAVLLAAPLSLWGVRREVLGAIALTAFVGPILVSLLGSAIPHAFHRMKVDPRVAAGPVVLSVADCTVLLFYLLMALFIAH